MLFRLAFFLFLVLPGILPAQHAVLSGRISDRQTGDPLPGATIVTNQGEGAVSNGDGYYFLKSNPGKIIVRFSYIGYKTRTHQWDAISTDTLMFDVALEPDITQIDQIVVSAGRVEQRLAESTVSLTVIEPRRFQSMHIANAHELINKTPGIEVIDG